jgi:outer membrane protein assembly factor BamB
MNKITALALIASTSTLFAAADAVEWNSYRGPNGNGVTAAAVGKPWTTEGPKAVWTAPATKGFSSVASAGGIAATLMLREHEGSESEHIVVWDAKAGKELWASPLQYVKYQGGGDDGTGDNRGGDGPRSTPAIDGGKVYVYGGNLDLSCYDGKTGKVVWKKDIAKDYGGKNISWQNATSPLIEGDLVIVGGGGKGQAFLAFDKKAGTLRWKGEDDTITHATPVPATIHGERQIIFFTKEGLAALSPKGGKVLWRQPFKFNVSTAASPVVSDNIVFCSAGYGVGGGAYEVIKKGSAWSTTELWRKEGNDVANHWSTPVAKDGMLYGMFQFKNYGNGPVKCVDIKTGDIKWSQEGFGPGNIILAGDTLLALSDKGELVQIAASPEGYKELARADVLEGKCWSTPTLIPGHIFARSTTQAACFAIVP